jgi:HlyD family secretion protein
MSESMTSRSRLRKFLPTVLAGGGILAVVAAVVLTQTSGLAASSKNTPTFSVLQGPLTISVIESGTIKAQDQIILKSELEGQTTLIYLIPEGTRAEEGQLLAELDSSKLKDDRVEQVIKVDNAEAEFVRSRENLAVVRNQAEADVSKAQLAYDFAQEDLTKYDEGEYPQQLREAESKITIAAEERERATEKLNWSEKLFQEKYISQTELEADRLTQKRADLDWQLAVAAKALLEKYTHERQSRQLQSDADQARMALERAKLKANADTVQAEADLKAKEAEFQQQKNKLAKCDDQIRKTKLTAPREGLVVYATSTRTGGGGRMTQPLEEGQTVRERQELIYLPSTQAMMAELMIHESSLEKVQVGQPVEVTVDAMPGKSFAGRVKSIAPLPDASTMFMNPDRKVYTTRVNLDGNNPDLRTGMSCRAEIMIQKLDDATYVPVQAVVRVGGQPTVFVRAGDLFQPRVVETGWDNSSMVHIASGLRAGETVNLAPPLDSGTIRFAAAAPKRVPGPVADAAPAASTQPAAERGPTQSGRPGASASRT